MSDHEIRLRGGWQIIDRSNSGHANRQRLTLPIDWTAAQFRCDQLRLSRSFQRPPTDPETESVWLCLESCPGMTDVSINGAKLAANSLDGQSCFEILTDPYLRPRNELLIDVNLDTIKDIRLWGVIALVIRSAEAYLDCSSSLHQETT